MTQLEKALAEIRESQVRTEVQLSNLSEDFREHKINCEKDRSEHKKEYEGDLSEIRASIKPLSRAYWGLKWSFGAFITLGTAAGLYIKFF